jgi:hypothetical protein
MRQFNDSQYKEQAYNKYGKGNKEWDHVQNKYKPGPVNVACIA